MSGLILTTTILVILLGCWINGRQQGFMEIVIHTATYIIGWILARVGSRALGTMLSAILPSISNSQNVASKLPALSQDSNQFFYNGLAFMIIFYGGTFLSRWLIKRLRFLKKVPVIGTANRWLGGLLDVLVGYTIIFMLLVIFQVWPGAGWQDQLAQSGLAQWMITETPILAREAINWFI